MYPIRRLLSLGTLSWVLVLLASLPTCSSFSPGFCHRHGSRHCSSQGPLFLGQKVNHDADFDTDTDDIDEETVDDDDGVFDVFKKWDPVEFWGDVIDSSKVLATQALRATKLATKNEEDSLSPWLLRIGKGFSDLLKEKLHPEETITELISTLTTDDDDTVESDTSFPQILSLLIDYRSVISSVLSKYLGDLDFGKLNPSGLFYYLEYEDERKNPSWKRRMHRFYPPVRVEQVEELNEAMILAGLAYADSVENIQRGLDQCSVPASLVFAQLSSKPAEPSHFIAVKRHQAAASDAPLEVTMVIRGTKTLADAVTDLCGDTVDYKGGKVHEFMLKSGRYLVDSHIDMLLDLCDKAGKSALKLTLIGHSLGAGAAALVAMELQEMPNLEMEVYGFGTPSILSEQLAENMTSCMTTVIADSDVVARLNGVTLANALLDVMEFDYRDRARRDVQMALNDLQRKQPVVFSDEVAQEVLGLFDPLLETHMKVALKKEKTERMQPVLFPPGSCIHFYQDGYEISGHHVPNTFFREIDVTRRMIRDHLRFGYEQMFLDLMRYHNQDLYYTFDTVDISDFNKQQAQEAKVKDS